MKRLLPFLLLLVSMHWAQGQDTLFVNGDPNLSIDNSARDGSKALPYETIEQAVEAANTQPTEGVTIIAILSFVGTDDVLPTYQLESSVSITRSVELTTSEADVGLVSIQAPTDGPCFRVDTPDTVRIRNLTLFGTSTSIGISITNASNLTVANNVFESFNTGILVQDAGENIFFSENIFDDNIIGISIASDEGTNGSSEDLDLTVFSNSFVTTEVGTAIDNESTQIINAEYNWWDSQEADVVANAVSDNVDYSPWLGSGDSEALFGFQGDFSAVTLGGGPQYDSTRNELQEAFNQTTGILTLVGSTVAYPSLTTTTSGTLFIEDDTAISVDTITVTGGELSVEGNLLINDSLSLSTANFSTIGDNSLVTIADDVVVPDEAGQGRMVGRFALAPRIIGEERTEGLLGVTIGEGNTGLGVVSVTRINGEGTAVQSNGNESIDCRWIILTENEPTGDRELSLAWRQEDSNGKDFSGFEAVVWRLPDEGDQLWTPVGIPRGATEAGNFRTISIRTTLFSTWTVSSINEPLPVTLTDFTARLDDTGVRLDWTTSSEINSDYFAVERSTDGYSYEPLARSKAAGESQIEQNYLYIDEGVTNRLAGIVYYRLHMVDFDGSSEYSPVVAVSLKGERPLLVYADHRDGTFKLFATLPEAGYTVQVSDLLGDIVYETYLPVQPNVREYLLPVPPLAQSVYTLRCRGDQDTFVRKFRVE